MSDESAYGDDVYNPGTDDPEVVPQYDAGDTLEGDDVTEDPLDAGYSPPDHEPRTLRIGVTDAEQAEGETLDERLAEEEPEQDPLTATQDADPRAGRLVAPDEGAHDDVEKDEIAQDVGIAGGAPARRRPPCTWRTRMSSPRIRSPTSTPADAAHPPSRGSVT